MNVLKFFFTHSVFIACCAFALVAQSYIIFNIPINFSICNLLFFSTLATYNVYWMISKWNFRNKKKLFAFTSYVNHFILFIISTIGIMLGVYHNQWTIPLLIAAGVLTLMYFMPMFSISIIHNRKNKGVLKTMLLALTWTFVTVIIPLIQFQSIPFAYLFLFFSVRFTFLWILCVIFDDRDHESDQLNGLFSIATDLNKSTLDKMMIIVFFLYNLFLLLAKLFFINEMQFYILLITGLLAFVLYRFSGKKKSYFFYHFLVDGLMLFSGIFSYIASI